MISRSRYLAIGASLLVFFSLLYIFRTIVGYVLIAWVLSTLGQPVMKWLRKRMKFGRFKAGNNLCAAITLLFLFVSFLLLASLFVPLVVEQAGNLASVSYASIAETLQSPYEQLQAFLSRYGMLTQEASLEEALRKSLGDAYSPDSIGNLFTYALSASGSLLISLFSVLFITFFFLKERGIIINMLVLVLPNEYEGQIKRAVEEITYLLSRYFGGILLQISIITVYVTIGLSLLGIENALLIGFFAGLINVIPYLGPIIGATFGMFIVIASHLELEFYTEMLPLLIKVLIVFSTVQLLDNFVLQPFIFSTSVLAHPLEIFIVILMGAQLNGIVGMILAIPTYTVLRVIARVFFQRFRLVQQVTKSLDEKPKPDRKDGGSPSGRSTD